VAPVGILALQGDFSKHLEAVRRVGRTPLLVRKASELEQCERLIIPGGESTTFLKLIERLELREPLYKYCSSRPAFGTCAGLIILAKNVVNLNQNPLGLIDITVQRNAYGRQIDSFVDKIVFTENHISDPFEAVFIRAPKILKVGEDSRVIARHVEEPVMAANKNILVATFHPELTEDNRIHEFFINRFAQ